MNRLWAVLCFVAALVFVATAWYDGAIAVVLVGLVTVSAIGLIRTRTSDPDFLIELFFTALFLRLAFGLVVHLYDLRSFFGNDAKLYDLLGKQLAELWGGRVSFQEGLSFRASSTTSPGWGMNYLTGIVYFVFGPVPLAVQSFCGAIGAATAPMVYVCTNQIFSNRRASKVAALTVALFPAFIIWSGQMLKDGLIVFLLVLAMTMVLQLQKQFSYAAVILLIFSLFGILSLRFYIFYMVAIAVAGSFVLGQIGSAKSIARGLILLVVVGLALTYLGVLRTATENFDRYVSLERVQRSRLDLATSAESGFGDDIDVSTTEGAITAIPIGLLYLMLAPFPWQMNNLRQAITLPEVLLWWAMIPLIFSGLVYTVKHRLREAIPILIFTLMLTVAYSIFQGNVGTAYRQRTQIQVFLFMFIAVGWTIMQEKRENRRASQLAARKAQEARLAARGAGS